MKAKTKRLCFFYVIAFLGCCIAAYYAQDPVYPILVFAALLAAPVVLRGLWWFIKWLFRDDE